MLASAGAESLQGPDGERLGFMPGMPDMDRSGGRGIIA